MLTDVVAQPVEITYKNGHDAARRAGVRAAAWRRQAREGRLVQPCTIAFSIMQWMPLEPLTVWVTRRSAARLHSV
jgi:hypothetical protein